MPTTMWRDLIQSFKHWVSSPSAHGTGKEAEENTGGSVLRETPDQGEKPHKHSRVNKSRRKKLSVQGQEAALTVEQHTGLSAGTFSISQLCDVGQVS